MAKKIIIRILAMVVVFFGTIYFANRWDNIGMDKVTAEMDKPTLPLLYMLEDTREINCLHGYTSLIDVSLFHDSITPIGKDQTVRFRVEDGMDFSSVGYELRSADGQSLIEDGTVDELTHENGSFYATTKLRMPMTEMQEYQFTIVVTEKEGREIRYYTRLIASDDLYTEKFLAFAESFHNGTFNKSEPSLVAPYIEPDETGENENLSHTTIHSSFEAVTWANLSVMRISQLTPTIKEIDGENISIEVHYAAISGDIENTQYLNVTEEYRLKKADAGKIFLMDFDRRVENVFDRFNVNTTKNWFFLGVSDLNSFEYRISDNNEKFAFVKEGQLWYYDYRKTQITKVFAFWQDSPTDVRTTYNGHGINIVKFDDEGNITFTVYGYMNRGAHEGENGISVYRFYADSSKLEEVLFLSCSEPYEVLKEDASRLTYLNEKDEFYYLLGDNVMKVDLNTKESSYCIYHCPKEYIAVSENESLLAYPEDNTEQANRLLHVLDMESDASYEVSAADGECIRALGFVDDDLVVGFAHAADIRVNADSSVVFPIHTMQIVTPEGQLVKEYQKDGMYVMNSTVEDGMIHMIRATKNGDTYVQAPDDFITFKEADANGIQVGYQYTYDGYNQLYAIFPGDMYVTSIPELMITKEVRDENSDTIVVNSVEKSNRYYVYAKGGLEGSYASARQAVLAANACGGRALAADGHCIWKISGLLEYAEVTEGLHERSCELPEQSLETCIRIILDYEGVQEPETLDLAGTPDEVLARYLGKSGVNLVGCDVDNALFYLCQGAPVITKISPDTYVLIISYNTATIRYYNPVTGEEDRIERYIIQQTFEDQGNSFFTYVH